MRYAHVLQINVEYTFPSKKKKETKKENVEYSLI